MRLSPDTHDARPTGAPSVLARRLAAGALGTDLLDAARRAARARTVAPAAARPDRLSIPVSPVDPDDPPRRPAA